MHKFPKIGLQRNRLTFQSFIQMWHLLALHQRHSSDCHTIKAGWHPTTGTKIRIKDSLAAINSHNSHNTPCVVRGSQPKVSLPHHPVVTDSCGLYGHHLRCEMHNSADVWSIKNWDWISSSLLKPSWVHMFFGSHVLPPVGYPWPKGLSPKLFPQSCRSPSIPFDNRTPATQ